MSSNKNYIQTNLTTLQAARYSKVMSLQSGNGGWTNKSLKSLGVNIPPTTGWLRRYVLNGPDYEPIISPLPEEKQMSLI